ncbi:MAG: hypothetical protein AUH05_13720 [Ktedonobacter sp. 13_2_20CM_53_11]|nr:MAG: hypothetical protein AUH05_13720 [Ktedonobacter sp. 13_2_20CM_53_11]
MAKHTHRTAVFTLHIAKQDIRDILDEALNNYTRAYTEILDLFKDYTAQELHAMSVYGTKDNGEELFNARTLETRLFRPEKKDARFEIIQKILEPLEARLRASLKTDVASTLSSYAELSLMEKQKPSYPNRIEEHDLEQRRLDALEGLRTIADDLEEENQLRDQSLRTRQRGLVPLSFANSMPDQGFRIFLNRVTNRFYVRLYVIGASSIYRRKITNKGEYIDIREPENIYMRHEDAKDREDVKSFGTGTRSILAPIKLGRWHENGVRFTSYGFLSNRWHTDAKPSKKIHIDAKPAWPVTAKLMKHGDEYQLHVVFQFEKTERIKPATYLGIDRSMDYLASGAVVSMDGKEVIETFNVSTDELHRVISAIEKNIATKQAKGKTTKGDRRRARIADRHVHLCANSIVEMAKMHQAQVVVEDLSYLPPPKKRGKRGKIFNRVLQRRQYQKLQDVLETKLEIAGLPPLRKVSAAFTASTCTQCGCVDKENFDKENRSLFRCIECGHETDVYRQSGINIVRKMPFLQLRSNEKQREVPENQRTTWEQFARQFKK